MLQEYIQKRIEEENKKFLALAEKHRQMAEICEKAANTMEEAELDALAEKYADLFLSTFL